MIGLDTNILVRYLTQDDPKQSPKATRLVESLTVETPGYITLVSVVELVWVLDGCYGSTKDEVCEVLETLLRSRELVVAEAGILWKALPLYRNGKADFADILIERLSNAAGCIHTATFDHASAKVCGMRLVD